MKNILTILVFCLVVVNTSFAAFPIIEKQPAKIEVTTPSDPNAGTIKTSLPVATTHRNTTFLNKLHNEYIKFTQPQDRSYGPDKNSWMGPVSFILMFLPYGFILGIPFAIIARVNRYKNRGWALAALLLYPAAFVVALTVFIIMFII